MTSGHFGWGEAGWGEGGVAPVTVPEVDLTSQWSAGLVNLTRGSADVHGVGTVWAGNIAAGQLFLAVLPDEPEAGVAYDLAAVVDDDDLTLAAPWQGRTALGVPYLVHRRVSSLPRLHREDQGVAPLITYTLARIDLALAQEPGEPIGDWLLDTGAWNDAGRWDDDDVWQD